MGKILNEIYSKCDFEERYIRLFQQRDIQANTNEFENKLKTFEKCLSDENLLKEFRKLHNELLDLQSLRDGYLLKNLTIHGLALGIQVYTEIMQEGR